MMAEFLPCGRKFAGPEEEFATVQGATPTVKRWRPVLTREEKQLCRHCRRISELEAMHRKLFQRLYELDPDWR